MPRVASDRETPIVLTSVDGMQSIYAASTLGTMGYRQVFVLEGGVRAWVQAGQPVERGDLPPQDDELLPPYQRGEEAMRDYIRWEKLLVA
jgi:3-mercaptopyruvate sulfurtransferase SseA